MATDKEKMEAFEKLASFMPSAMHVVAGTVGPEQVEEAFASAESGRSKLKGVIGQARKLLDIAEKNINGMTDDEVTQSLSEIESLSDPGSSSSRDRTEFRNNMREQLLRKFEQRGSNRAAQAQLQQLMVTMLKERLEGSKCQKNPNNSAPEKPSETGQPSSLSTALPDSMTEAPPNAPTVA